MPLRFAEFFVLCDPGSDWHTETCHPVDDVPCDLRFCPLIGRFCHASLHIGATGSVWSITLRPDRPLATKPRHRREAKSRATWSDNSSRRAWRSRKAWCRAARSPWPTKVVRSALQHAASVGSLMITTEPMVAERQERSLTGHRRWLFRRDGRHGILNVNALTTGVSDGRPAPTGS